MGRKHSIAAFLAVVAMSSGVAWAAVTGPRTLVVWYSEHGQTIDDAQHSGGTDRYGCHNGSVPHHCH